jgi:plastocyanin
MNKKLGIILGIVLVILIVLVVFGIYKNNNDKMPEENTETNSNVETSETEIVEVSIEGFAFSPKSITVSKGTTVVWTNMDSIQHTATSDEGLFNSGLLSKGESWNYTFNEEGNYDYHCIPHPNMKGTIVVE